jgi:transposase
MRIMVLGIDLAKSVFQICGLSRSGRVQFNRQLRRGRIREFVAQLEPTVIAMEACPSSHYWGRVFEAMGHTVRLIPPQHVKAFLRVNKSDSHDALAIAEASMRPNLKFVPVKTIEQQDLQLVSRQRQRWIRHRTAVINQVRAAAREYGVYLPVGYKALRRALPEVLEDAGNELSAISRELIREWAEELRELDAKIKRSETEQTALVKNHPAYASLVEIPGFGPVVATVLLSSIGNARHFDNGRQMSAWVGLVPRHTGTGGVTRILGITKNGDRELRTMLIHGARAVVRWADRRDDALGRWIRQLKERRGANRAAVALANKMTRIAWAVVARGERFNLNKAFNT